MSTPTIRVAPPGPPSAAEERLFSTTGEALQAAEEVATRNGHRPAILDHMTPSGLRQKYIVELNGGRFIECQTTVQDVLRWERTYKKGWFDPNGMSVGRLIFITWSALKRAGEIDMNPQQFESELVELHLEDAADEHEPDPTNAAPGDYS
jgi:hypothetical protein